MGNNMVKTVFFILFLILITPYAIFGDDVEDVIRQQKNNATKEVEAARKEEEDQKAIKMYIEELTKIVADKIKELIEKGVKFQKDPGVLYYRNINGQRYGSDGGRTPDELILTSMYDDRLLVTSSFGTYIYFQPENGTKINMLIEFYKNGKCEVKTFGYFRDITNKTIGFKSYYDISELKRNRDKIHKIIVEAIKAAVDFGDK